VYAVLFTLTTWTSSSYKYVFCVSGLLGDESISAYSIMWQVEGFAWMVRTSFSQLLILIVKVGKLIWFASVEEVK
jgi:hypothetical protein